MKAKHILSVLLIMILSFSAVTAASCKGKEPEIPPAYIEDDGIDRSQVLDYIVRDGVSEYTIVYGDAASSAEVFAASEFQLYVGKMTGVYPSQTAESNVNFDENSKIVSVGNTALLESMNFDVDYSAMNTDGFIIKTYGKNVFINGASDSGTIYGVYDFLEKICNLKFLAYDYTYIPELTEIPVYKMDVLEIPAFETRSYMSGSATAAANELNMVHMRMANDYTVIPEEHGGGMSNLWYQGYKDMHNALEYVDPKVYYTEENKEANAHMFYRDKNDKVLDICYTDGITEDGKLDTGMPVSAAKIALESLKGYVTDAVEQGLSCKYFMFGQMDLTSACSCSRCLAATEKYSRSGNLIRFVNVLAEEIQKWADTALNGKEITIVTFAYQYTDTAPVRQLANGEYELLDATVKPRDNVCIRLAPIEAYNYWSLSDEKQSPKYNTWFKQWSITGNNFCLWTYHTMFAKSYFWYYPTLPAWQENLRDFRDMGVKYILMQSSHTEKHDWQALMETYIASKLLWDPDRDVNALQNEFIEYYYGDLVSDNIKLFMRNFDEHYALLAANGNSGVNFMLWNPALWSMENQPLNLLTLQDGIVDDSLEIIADSDLSSTEKKSLTDRLKRLKLTTLFMIIENYSGYYPGDEDGKIAMANEFFDICSELGVVQYAEGLSVASLKTTLLG